MKFQGVTDNILKAAGTTPMVRLNRLISGSKAEILLKLECLNPTGAGNDRTALPMLRAAQEKGQLKRGGTIIEASNGNTGISLAQCAAVLGYRAIITVPDKTSHGKLAMLNAYGAKVIVAPTAVPPTDPRSYLSVAKRLADEIPDAFLVNHSYNEENPKAQYETTGPEIWEQTGGKIDVFVAGLGSGGTMTGIGRFLREQNEGIRLVGVDPAGSLYADFHRTQTIGEPEFYTVEELGRDHFPTTLDFDLLDRIHTVTDKDCFNTARKLCRREGILVGGSAGGVVWAALQEARHMDDGQVLVALVGESGDRYLDKIYNDTWMAENQFLQEDHSSTAFDILMRKNTPMDHCVTVTPDTPVAEALKLMRQFQISQLPVLDEIGMRGVLSEGPIIDLVIGKKDLDVIQVLEIMDEPLPVVELSSSVERISALLASGNHAVMVKLGDWNYGIITKFDLIY